MAGQRIETTCCVTGGGPAGMMLGFLLARAGIDVTVLEKHADFLRDFRGDTIHPSTLDLMAELGLLERFLKLPHSEVTGLTAQVGQDRIALADFRHLPTRCKFIAFMPQWDFLDFLADEGRRMPNFRLLLSTDATGLIEEEGRVAGVRATAPTGPVEIRAQLTVGADGRHSTLRSAAGLAVDDFGAPMDVLWFRLSRDSGDAPESFGHAEAGRMMIMLNRGDYWQCAYVIAKGSHDKVVAGGLPAFRAAILEMSPFLGNRMDEIESWDQVKLLTVAVDRLPRWHRPGLLLIGDAAHAMSPIGGVGINLAIQDAVAAANLLAAPLAAGHAGAAVLQAVQDRRMFPTRVTQDVQLFIQKRIIDTLLRADKPLRAPWQMRLIGAIPILRRIPGYLVGVGVRPEHIQTPSRA